RRRGEQDHWFLHINLWDVHMPARMPAGYGDPFAGQPVPAWHTEAIRTKHFDSPGLRSARHMPNFRGRHPRFPAAIDSQAAFAQLIDGYDTSIRYVDDHIGRVISLLQQLGIEEETAILISADHGECLGELNAYAAHLFADPLTTRV